MLYEYLPSLRSSNTSMTKNVVLGTDSSSYGRPVAFIVAVMKVVGVCVVVRVREKRERASEWWSGGKGLA